MICSQESPLVKCLNDFVETHPGTRLGNVFGRPVAFAGHRVFAEIKDGVINCYLPLKLTKSLFKGGLRIRCGRRRGWIVLVGTVEDHSLMLQLLLEMAATYVTTNHQILPYR